MYFTYVYRFQQLKSKENEINELKSRFLRHRQILVSNYEQSEAEIKRIDEEYHDTVDEVLQVKDPKTIGVATIQLSLYHKYFRPLRACPRWSS